jgi:hypothetical protein
VQQDRDKSILPVTDSHQYITPLNLVPMAIQLATFLKGKIDNVVFYKRSGTYIARSLAVKLNQSAATKKRSRNFGIAATAGKILRQLLLPALPFPKDKSMQSQFAGALTLWLKQSDPETLPATPIIPYVSDFQFNRQTSVAERWELSLTVVQSTVDLIEVHIPFFVPTAVIAAPANTIIVECTLAAAACRLIGGEAMGSAVATISIPYNNVQRDAQIISLPVATGAGAVVLAVASLTFHLANGQACNDPAFMPSSVIDARYIA